MVQPYREQFLSLIAQGDESGATGLLQRHPELASHNGYTAHPLLCALVTQNEGHCYKQAHMRIADRLTPEIVRSFRDAVLQDQFDAVQDLLRADSKLIDAEITAGRGIAQPIHHWKSLTVGGLLVDADADLAALTTLGESPLTMQLRFGTVAGARFLLEKGANPNLGSGGHLPSTSMTELIELLLAFGWDINNGQMLHDANHGHGSRVTTWLKYGASPGAANECGQTAMHLFAKRGTGRGVIRALVEAGADINARDSEGNTPLDLARLASKQIATQVLIGLGAENSE